MKPLLACTVAIVLSVALLSAVKSKSQPTAGSQIRIVTSTGTALTSLFDGISPTAFGQRAVQQNREYGLSTPKPHKGGLCQNAKRSDLLLKDSFDGAHLTSACFEGGCAGHYVVLQEATRCQRCANFTYTIDIEGGDPNTGEMEQDIDCFGVCCASYTTCSNPCEPGECF